ncbi:MAG TPA: D-2-hydroxyacid dehydrogenase [Candidatus Eisenbergiella intestinipullorum]|nr:D-2-hydroxyacid dehydrogenase [Candidatus Eisenbergiella intestinipullorum]
MEACIITGHPAWRDSLNDVTRKMWEDHLSQIPEITSYRLYNVFGRSLEEQLDLIGDADVCIGLSIGPFLNEEFLSSHPRLKYIATLSMGYGSFDRELMKKYGVTLTATLYGAQTIAQFSMALLMDLCHNISYNADLIKNMDFSTVTDYCSAVTDRISRQIELYGKTMGIIGIGHVGLWVAKMASGFGMKVIGTSRTKKEGPGYELIEQVSLDELLARSDVISLNCSENPSSKGIINKNTISKMKDGVIIINDARGGLIVEEDLAEALNSGKVYAAGLDATSFDTLHRHIPLMDCPNTRITSHIAWFPMEARLRDIDVAAQNLRNYLEGHPTGVIN